MFFRTLKERKKAVIGVETLIIFIAMILVAAVAAAVIIRTSGVLQERAFAVSGQTRKRLVTGLEVIEVIGDTNRSVPNIANLEISVRLRSGSTPVQFRTTQLTFNTQNLALSAKMQHSTNDAFNFSSITVTNTTWLDTVTDFNEDGVDDFVRIGINCTGTYECVQFNISGVGLSNVSLGYDLSTATSIAPIENITVREGKIMFNGEVYGYVLVKNANATLSNSMNGTKVNVTQFPAQDVCSFDTLIPERFFCIEARLGSRGTVLEYGGLYIIKYKLKPQDGMVEDEAFQINLIPREGSITYIQGTIPDVLKDKKIVLWPS